MLLAREVVAARVAAEREEAEAQLREENRVLRRRLQVQQGRDEKALDDEILHAREVAAVSWQGIPRHETRCLDANPLSSALSLPGRA